MTIEIKRKLETYLKTKRETPTRLGRRICGDPRLMADLRAGRRVGPHLAKKIDRFLEENA